MQLLPRSRQLACEWNPPSDMYNQTDILTVISADNGASFTVPPLKILATAQVQGWWLYRFPTIVLDICALRSIWLPLVSSNFFRLKD